MGEDQGTKEEQTKALMTLDETTKAGLENSRGYVAYPGFINYVDERGNFPGCKLEMFTSTRGMNEFFREHPGLLVVKMEAAEHGFIYVLYTRHLNEDDQRLLEENAADWEVFKEARRKERADSQAKSQELQQTLEEQKEAEFTELIELGTKCKGGNHSALADENKKLRAELTKAKKVKS